MAALAINERIQPDWEIDAMKTRGNQKNNNKQIAGDLN
jgi:hypothetical protein